MRSSALPSREARSKIPQQDPGAGRQQKPKQDEIKRDDLANGGQIHPKGKWEKQPDGACGNEEYDRDPVQRVQVRDLEGTL
jgi:hypothetical protein